LEQSGNAAIKEPLKTVEKKPVANKGNGKASSRKK
jgi:hypothetical protein